MEICKIVTRKGCRWSLKKTAYAFAIYNLVKWTYTFALSITIFVSGPIKFESSVNPAAEEYKTKVYGYVTFVMSVAAFLFTTLLIIGLKKCKPSLLLTFFIYGIANETILLAAAAFVIYTLVIQDHLNSVVGYWMYTIFHGITIIGLVIVFKIYSKLIIGEVKQFSHSKLQEDTTTNTVRVT